MEQEIKKLSEMIGVGVSEIYTVLQSMANVDAKMELISFKCSITGFLLFISLLIAGGFIWYKDNESVIGVFFMIAGIIMGGCFASGIWESLRNYEMWKDNPKAYAIEKIFKNIPHE